MIRNSLLLGTLLSVWDSIYAWYLDSFLYRIWCGLCAFCARGMNGSLIVGFFRADWDAALHLDHIAELRILTKLHTWYAGESALARALRGSVLLSLLDERCLTLALCVVAFALPFAPTLVLLLGALASFALYILNVLLGRITPRGMSLFGVAAILFALCYTISALCGQAFPSSVEPLLMFLGLMTIVPVAASVLRDEKRRDIVITVFLLAAVVVSFYGMYQYVTGAEMNRAWVDKEMFGDLRRAYATFGNPNVMGEYLIIACSLSVGMFWKSKRWGKAFFFCVTGVLGVGLLTTGSRGAMLGLACSAAVFALLAEHRLLPFGVAAAAALPFVLPQSILYRFEMALTMKDTSTQYRMSIYSACWSMAMDHWLTGIGVAAFTLVYPRYAFAASNSYHSHNLFLQVFLELGIVGIALFALLLLFWMQKLYRRIARDVSAQRFLTGTILSGMVGLLVQGMTDHLWFSYRIVLLFWLVIGLGCAAASGEERA